MTGNWYPRPGAIVATSGETPTSRLIRLRTCSRYSHVAICAWVGRRDLQEWWPERDWSKWSARTLLFESTTLDAYPCEITGRRFDGIQAHTPAAWLPRYPGRVWEAPLYRSVRPGESQRLTDCLLALTKHRTPYDKGGAILAGMLAKWFPCLAYRVGNRRSMYCVELVESVLPVAFFERPLPPLDPGRDTPGVMVNKILDCGVWTALQRRK